MSIDNTYYSKHNAQRFIRLLGCWRSSDPEQASFNRDPREYQTLLQKHFDTNMDRLDRVGQWERDACVAELKLLNRK